MVGVILIPSEPWVRVTFHIQAGYDLSVHFTYFKAIIFY